MAENGVLYFSSGKRVSSYREAVRRAATAFAEAMRPLYAAFVPFGDAVHATIDRAYREAHPKRRLPKPTKTRWRKKRKKIVLAWFEQHVEEGGEDGGIRISAR